MWVPPYDTYPLKLNSTKYFLNDTDTYQRVFDITDKKVRIKYIS